MRPVLRFHAARRCAPSFRSAARAARRPRSRRGWGRGTRLPAAPGSGIETSLRAKRATASSDSWFCFCERGSAPFHIFPLVTRAPTRSRKVLVAAIGLRRRPSGGRRRVGSARDVDVRSPISVVARHPRQTPFGRRRCLAPSPSRVTSARSEHLAGASSSSAPSWGWRVSGSPAARAWPGPPAC